MRIISDAHAPPHREHIIEQPPTNVDVSGATTGGGVAGAAVGGEGGGGDGGFVQTISHVWQNITSTASQTADSLQSASSDVWAAHGHHATLQNTLYVLLLTLAVLLVLGTYWWYFLHPRGYVRNRAPRRCLKCASCIPGAPNEHIDHPCIEHDACMEYEYNREHRGRKNNYKQQ